MKIFLQQTVREKALERINFLFDEFDNVIIGMSGGKDSTVTFELSLAVAKERGRLPLKVMWIDQEGEWQGTVDYVKEVMYRKDVEPYWLQIPMVMTNNASSYDRYSYCWKEGDNYLHPKDPISIKENTFGTDRFHELFGAFLKKTFPKEKACYLSGVRAEEAPKRLMSLTSQITYKDVTWGKKFSGNHYTFYPLYDWSYTDIWKCINDDGFKYNRVYDELYRHGVSVRDMRISNLHHETAVQNLLLVQEIEPKTWERLADKIAGANTIKHLDKNSFTCPRELPPMFYSWSEYAEHLTENIVQEKKYRDLILNQVLTYRKYILNPQIERDFYRVVINTILSSDWDCTKLINFVTSQNFNTVKKYVDGGITDENREINRKYDKYVKGLI